MRFNRVLPFVVIIIGLIGCAPVQDAPTQTTIVTVSVTSTPELEQITAEPTMEPAVKLVLRSLLGDDGQGELANSVIELDNGDFLVAGYDYVSASNDSQWDALVMRISPDGEEVWRYSSDVEGSEYAWVVRESDEGQFLAVGAWESEAGDMDGYMQGFDADGNALWLQTYGGEMEEILWAAEKTPDGGFLLAGETDSQGAGGLDFYIVRTDADGNEIWSNAYGTSTTDRAFGIGITPDGGALISGFTGENHDTMNFFFVRINEDGRELWRRTTAGDRFDVAHDVLILEDGGFVISGYTSSFSPGDRDGFLMRLDPRGRMLWVRMYDSGSGDDRILHVAQTHDGGYALIGFTNGNLAVWRVDKNGEFMWLHRDGGANTDVGKDVIVARDGSIVVVGGNRSANPPHDDIILLVLTD